MKTKEATGTTQVTDTLDRVAQRFTRWRNTRDRGRIPKGLWQQAVEQAQIHGVERTAEVLQLNIDRLRRQMPSGKLPDRCVASPMFVELTPVPAIAYTVEFIRPEGARMRVELPGAQPQALLALANAFLVHTR